MGLGKVIYNRLTSNTSISAAVKGHILPEFRDDLCPSIVYEANVTDPGGNYQGAGPVKYEVILTVIAETYEKSVEIADSIVEHLDYTDWTNSDGTKVIGSFFLTREEDSIENASKNKRLVIVDLRFEWIVI